MFSGIIYTTGTLTQVISFSKRGDKRLVIFAEGLDFKDLKIGSSIAVDGVCLTILKIQDSTFWVDVSLHTLSCTTLGTLQKEHVVNLEPPLRLNDFLSGHLVTGHVDGIGQVVTVKRKGRSKEICIQIPKVLCRYVSPKGSICVNGVSLTVNTVAPPILTVNLISHTLAHTTFKFCQVGGSVNIEVDILARYIENWMAFKNDSSHS
ncbi:MAG: riboflavin synthase [Gammaproteobacteria bacterium]|nr:riboflavin synthase [Gammaproteobacteria bacterium]